MEKSADRGKFMGQRYIWKAFEKEVTISPGDHSGIHDGKNTTIRALPDESPQSLFEGYDG